MTDRTGPGVRVVSMLRVDRGEISDDVATVVDEAAVALVYNGVSHAVMMMTPQDLEDFALGFSLGEGIVASADELRFIEAVARDDGTALELHVPQLRFEALQSRQRRTVGVSACGLCGSESLAAALREVPAVDATTPVQIAAIEAALQALDHGQILNRATGGAHAAVWSDGTDIVLREDVGRHCALDKLIGALVRGRGEYRDGFVVVSSRASYELVHKVASAGIGVLVAISAPTSAAIDLAERLGVCLIAFARGPRMNVYTHRTRLAGFPAA